MVEVYSWSELSPNQRKLLLQRPSVSREHIGAVEQILTRVKEQGDSAVTEMAQQWDGLEGTQWKISPDRLQQCWEELEPELKKALLVAKENILNFHGEQKPKEISVTVSPGLICSQRPTPLERVGFYIPGGTAPLFSSVLMLALPAQIAGCNEVALFTPGANPFTLAAAHLCGVEEVYAIGGAHAVGVMAYGTETVRPVHKIFGPGNNWVTEAKNQVSPKVAIDMPAGPSEVLVVADHSADPEFITWDLLSQAEHGLDSQVILVSPDEELLNNTKECLRQALERVERNSFAKSSLQQSRFILVEHLGEAIDVSNQYAPEHLILNVQNAQSWSDKVKHAGSVFLGPWSPESCGDYASGTNHVLPTHGAATSYSGVSLQSFYKYITFQQLSRQALEELGPSIVTLAEAEQLQCHAEAIRVRLKKGAL